MRTLRLAACAVLGLHGALASAQTPPTGRVSLTFPTDDAVLLLGLTATPCRQGGKGLGAFYRHMTLAPSVQELIDLGYLVPGTYYAPTIPDLSAARYDYKRGDYVVDDIDQIMGGNQIMGDVVEHWLKHAGGRSTIVFACSIKHSVALAQKFPSPACVLSTSTATSRTPSVTRCSSA